METKRFFKNFIYILYHDVKHNTINAYDKGNFILNKITQYNTIANKYHHAIEQSNSIKKLPTSLRTKSTVL